MIQEGRPFKGRELEKVKHFLKRSGLNYDEGIEYTVCVLDEEYKIIGTGSVQNNVIKCVAIDENHRGQGISGEIITHLLQYEFENGCSHIYIYTKPENKVMFGDMGFHTIIETESVLFMENRKFGFAEYLQELIEETPEPALEKNKNIGCVVANCNPFTLGHKYLLETAQKSCDYLHLFILSEDRSFFSSGERYEMVKAGIEGMEKIILHRTSDYIISAATFPVYFFKDQMTGKQANCELDLRLFGEQISKKLGITKRFVGTEPVCSVTKSYNEMMKQILPQYGIEVVELERKKIDQQYISASTVRKLLMEGKKEAAKEMVPLKVYNIMEKISRMNGKEER